MKNKSSRKIIIILIFMILLFIYNNHNNDTSKQMGEIKNVSSQINNNTEVSSELLTVSFIDVGQADSILIEHNNKYVLIDAGNEEDGKKLVDYFNKLNITEFEYVIATHPHEDHIGGMDDVINNFTVNNFYMSDALTTTKTFENLLTALENKNLKYKVPTISDTFLVDDCEYKVLYVDSNASNLNDDSIVVKLKYGNNSFLFMGDASTKVEKKILTSDISADVLKLGHHGSSYSSKAEFLDKVNPKYAIVSAGVNNIYNHPSQSVIDMLNSRNIKIYRTDKEGTIIVTSDKKNINIKTERTDTNG